MAKENLELMTEAEIRKLNKTKELSENFYKYRDEIVEAYGDVIFIEGSHKYLLNGVELVPVTSMIHMFQSQPDWDKIKKNFAKKNHVSVDTVTKWWTLKNVIATNSGTHVHEFAESCYYHYTCQDDKILPMFKRQLEKGFFVPNSGKELAAIKFWDDIMQTPGLYPMLVETKVYSAKINGIYPYAGMFDLMMYYEDPVSGKDGVVIMDYKTNDTLYSDYNRANNNTLLFPFDDMVDEAFSHYELQLAAYQIPIEKGLGIPVLGRRIIHLKDDGSYELIRVGNKTDRLFEALQKIEVK